MGFYIDLVPVGPRMERFEESAIPSVFWVLYGILGFALLCMGTAAHAVLGDLLKIGSTFDLVVLSLIFSALPIYLLLGIKLLFVRKFVSLDRETLKRGFRFAGKEVLVKRFSKRDAEEILLVNRKPSPNVAVRVHDDSQYHLRGHWRILLRSGNKYFTLDKHTDPGALEPLYRQVLSWKGETTSL